MKIRVATYNIHKGVTSFGSTPRVVALKKAIGLFEADVVFLQEVQGKHENSPPSSAKRAVATVTGPKRRSTNFSPANRTTRPTA